MYYRKLHALVCKSFRKYICSKKFVINGDYNMISYKLFCSGFGFFCPSVNKCVLY